MDKERKKERKKEHKSSLKWIEKKNILENEWTMKEREKKKEKKEKNINSVEKKRQK